MKWTWMLRKSKENLMKFDEIEWNLNLKIWTKSDEIWSEQKSNEKLMKFEVYINLKKIGWNKKKLMKFDVN